MFHGPSYEERASAAVASSWAAQPARKASKCLFMTNLHWQVSPWSVVVLDALIRAYVN